MATTASKGASEMPTFSYAQAAKGFSTPAPAPAADQQAKSAQTSDQKSNTQPIANGTDAKQSTASVDVASSTHSSTDYEKSSLIEGQAPTKDSLTVSTDAPASTKNTVSGATSPSHGTASTATLPRDDDISITPNGSSDSTWDKQSQISGPIEKPDQSTTGSVDKSENGDKAAPAPKELKAAPIPAVNIWQQRMETQNAKAKSSAVPKPNGTLSAKAAAKFANASQQTEFDNSKSASKKKAGGASDATSDSKNTRKGADGNKKDEGEYGCSQRAVPILTIRTALKKNGLRGNRQVKTDPGSTGSAPPPVGDAASWPTPQLAQGEEKRKAQEKTDKGGDKEKSPVVKTSKKDKWMPVPYVPSAVFNTTLPPVARRGGGRPTRGGRDGATRGRGHGATPSTAGDKSVTGSTNQNGKQSTPSERGRNESSATQTEPIPAQARRHTSADAALSPEQRKTTQAHLPERFANSKFSKGPLDNNMNGNATRPEHPHMNGSETLPRHRQEDPRSFSGPRDPSTFQKGVEQQPRHVSLQGDYNGPNRYGASRERRFDNGPRSAEFFREPSNGFNSRDTRERGDSRPERGRGGYRGRGGHSTFTGSQNQQYPVYQQGNHTYQPPKSYRHQQGPQNGPQPQNPNQRLNLRSPSLPNSGMYNSYPAPADFNAMYGYAPMHPAPMNAVPFQQYQEPVTPMSMIAMQLEYYFSVDNLCKDMFLRKHMDSQGFVPLSVIANFKRIKSLAEDIELLRHVCRQIKGVEYRLSEDGVDRLRKKEKWEQWVLSMDMRDPSAQHEGPPPPAVSYSPVHVDNVYENHFPMNVNHAEEFIPPMTNGSAHHAHSASRSGLTNGVNGTHFPKTPLSSTAPEFSPMTAQRGNVNGGTPGDQNTFRDEQIQNLVIVVRKPGFSNPPPPASLSPTSSSFRDDLVDGYRTTEPILNPEEPPLSPTQAETTSSQRTEPSQLQETSGNTPSTPVSVNDYTGTDSSTSTFWVKDRDAPIEVLPTDLLHESYDVFRNRAIQQHETSTTDDGHRDMDVLYQFWSHFLIRNFNAGMYNEFKSLAFDDVSSKGSTRGRDHLVRFFDAVLSSGKCAISDDVARDLVITVKTESAGDVLLQRLRSAWKDEAFNAETRAKIDRVLDEDLRAELEK
ncbi:hypothetical protein FQN54_005687 [Arachnomyces sp. PD_36]|nr:hypothetical protein FQN54_005687 [Arachnomyces sp. PD_36]